MKALLRIAVHVIVAVLLTAPLAAQQAPGPAIAIDRSSAGVPASEGQLPPGGGIRFHLPTLWGQYRGSALAITTAILVQAALIFWLIYEHWRRQTAEQQSIQRVNELARMNRFATAGELSASIAHELRQPLAAIAMSASAGLNWLKRPVPDLEEARLALQSIVKESHRADDVIKGVRSMFKDEPPVKTPVNLNELIQDVLKITEGSINSNRITLDVNLSSHRAPLVTGDPVQLRQVILNLVVNAVEALGHPGHGPRRLQLTTAVSPSGSVLARVVDSGPNIDPNVAEKLFEPFFTTKAGGMGMGLSICKTIIAAHEGSLTAAPCPPHGMQFQIVLPPATEINSQADG